MTTIIATVGLYALNAVLIPFYVLISRFLQNPAAVAISDLTTAAISTITVAAMGAAIAFLLSLPLAFLMTQGSSTFGSISAVRIPDAEYRFMTSKTVSLKFFITDVRMYLHSIATDSVAQ